MTQPTLAVIQAWWACPWCGTDLSERVAAGILSSDFPAQAAGVVLPFAVAVAVTAAIHYWPRRIKVMP